MLLLIRQRLMWKIPEAARPLGRARVGGVSDCSGPMKWMRILVGTGEMFCGLMAQWTWVQPSWDGVNVKSSRIL